MLFSQCGQQWVWSEVITVVTLIYSAPLSAQDVTTHWGNRNMCCVFFLLLKVLPHCITCACWDSGCPLAGVVTPYRVLDTGLIANITSDLTGGVVTVRCYWMAAVQTTCADVGVVQKWTSYSWGRIKKIEWKKKIGSVKAGILCTTCLITALSLH